MPKCKNGIYNKGGWWKFTEVKTINNHLCLREPLNNLQLGLSYYTMKTKLYCIVKCNVM